MSELTRREWLRAAMAAGVGAAIGNVPSIARAQAFSPVPAKPNALRFAHLTDMHVTDKNRGDQGFALALRSLQQHQPAFIITGGDHVMDASGQLKTQAVAWYDMYERILGENTKLPVYPCIGNHDVYGWTTQEASPSDPDFGKAMALDRLKLKSRYYSFDRGGWHFVILDNIMRREPHYYADFDAEQSEWLSADLASSKLPKVLVTHIPILSITGVRNDPDGTGYDIAATSMQHNVRPLLALLRRHNVKLCLSGHMHHVDQVDYLGIKFCCNGAVSGRWWQGPNLEFDEGYGLIDLNPDGTLENRYVTYGWKAPV